MDVGPAGCRNPAGKFLGSFPKPGYCAATEGAGNKEKVSVCIEHNSTFVLLFFAEITYIKYVEIRQFTEAKQIIFLYNLFSKIKKFIDFRL